MFEGYKSGKNTAQQYVCVWSYISTPTTKQSTMLNETLNYLHIVFIESDIIKSFHMKKQSETNHPKMSKRKKKK